MEFLSDRAAPARHPIKGRRHRVISNRTLDPPPAASWQPGQSAANVRFAVCSYDKRVKSADQPFRPGNRGVSSLERRLPSVDRSGERAVLANFLGFFREAYRQQRGSAIEKMRKWNNEDPATAAVGGNPQPGASSETGYSVVPRLNVSKRKMCEEKNAK